MPSSTPIYGLPYPLGTDPVTNGAQDIEDLALAVETLYESKTGLIKIASLTTLGSANPFINSCFSSEYANYRIIFSFYGSASQPLRMRLRYSTSTVETNTVYDRSGFTWTTSVISSNSANEVSLYLGTLTNSSSQQLTASIDVFNPNVSNVQTTMLAQTFSGNLGYIWTHACRVETTTQYTGFDFIADGPSSIAGSVTVYGYK